MILHVGYVLDVNKGKLNSITLLKEAGQCNNMHECIMYEDSVE